MGRSQICREDAGEVIRWNASDPSPFDADSGRSPESGRLQIRIRRTEADQSDETFEYFWRCVVFELHNAARTKEFARISEQARNGKLGREEYIMANCATEEQAKERTRAFYLKHFLPWLRSKNLHPATAANWYCFSFYRDEKERNTAWKQQPHWNFYSASFDIQRARAALRQRDSVLLAKHLAQLDACKPSLTSQQLANLRRLENEAALLSK